ncbi:MAG TPA: hypothetical protein VK638_33560 [Edaphobacter sp.]|nr:hypothetical protein [Edaphobacter sp.]
MTDNIDIVVSTPEAAKRLQENFEEVLARVNGDLMSHTIQPDDPISVEAAVAFAERCIDHHMATFADDAPLQSLTGEMKQRFRKSIELQANAASPH